MTGTASSSEYSICCWIGPPPVHESHAQDRDLQIFGHDSLNHESHPSVLGPERQRQTRILLGSRRFN